MRTTQSRAPITGASRTESVEHLLDGGMHTVQEASALLNMSKSFLYQQMDLGRLCYARFGRARRIPKQALIQFAQENLVGH